MKYLKQLTIIIFISFLGELLNRFIPLPIPASVYGIILMFAALSLKIIPLAKVEDAGGFLLEIMPVLFVPAGAGLLTVWDKMSADIFEIAAITVISTVLVMVVTGRVSQAIIKRKGKDND